MSVQRGTRGIARQTRRQGVQLAPPQHSLSGYPARLRGLRGQQNVVSGCHACRQAKGAGPRPGGGRRQPPPPPAAAGGWARWGCDALAAGGLWYPSKPFLGP